MTIRITTLKTLVQLCQCLIKYQFVDSILIFFLHEYIIAINFIIHDFIELIIKVKVDFIYGKKNYR